MRTQGSGIVFEKGALVLLLRHWNEEWRSWTAASKSLNWCTYMILPSSLTSFLLIALFARFRFLWCAAAATHNTKIRWDTLSLDFSSKNLKDSHCHHYYVVYRKRILMAAVRNALEMVGPRPQPTKTLVIYLMGWYVSPILWNFNHYNNHYVSNSIMECQK